MRRSRTKAKAQMIEASSAMPMGQDSAPPKGSQATSTPAKPTVTATQFQPVTFSPSSGPAISIISTGVPK